MTSPTFNGRDGGLPYFGRRPSTGIFICGNPECERRFDPVGKVIADHTYRCEHCKRWSICDTKAG